MKQVPVAEKIFQARQLMKELHVDAWLIWVRETGIMRDPSLDMILGNGNVTWQSAFIIPVEGDPVAIVGRYDVKGVEDSGVYPQVIGHDNGPSEALRQVFCERKFKKVMLNYCKDSETADGLTVGMYQLLEQYLGDLASGIEFVSSLPVLSALRSVKTAGELELMRQSAEKMLEIFGRAINLIVPGVTEHTIAFGMQTLIEVNRLEYAWDKNHCPSVFTGPNTAEAHYPPSDRKVEPGHLVFIDCGVKVGGYCSDLQRTYYVGHPDEDRAPEPAQKAFRAVFDGITNAAEKMKPGVLGWEVDAACRNHITSLGYSEYPHATGHGIGLLAHDGAAGLFPKWERYGNRPNMELREGEVYTIEPRISVPDMGIVTVEEMVVVTPEGGEFLSDRQTGLLVLG